MRASIEQSTGAALAEGSVFALVVMALLAVLREGFETAVFLVAAFNASANAQATGTGATLGLLSAFVIGYGIYRGGVRINLARFFLGTGLLLVLIAAGLVASGLHSAHEAGWVNTLQSQPLDLRWLVRPGTVVSAVVTGTLGIQARPTVAEELGWLLYLVPVAAYLVLPRRPRRWGARPHLRRFT
jgi:high-affinity iron transporter